MADAILGVVIVLVMLWLVRSPAKSDTTMPTSHPMPSDDFVDFYLDEMEAREVARRESQDRSDDLP